MTMEDSLNEMLWLEDSFCRATIDKALINMIITDLQPVSIVQDKGFIDFWWFLIPNILQQVIALTHNQLPQLHISRQELLLQ